MKDQKFSLQEYLSLGYIYLLVLGIGSDMIYYGLLGINILQYSTISDVLLSPISLLGDNIIVPAALMVVAVIMYLITKFNPKFHKRNKHKRWYRKLHNVEKLDKKYQKDSNYEDIFKAIAFGLLFMFLGLRTGMGLATKGRIEKNDLKIENSIEFVDGQKQQISLLGKIVFFCSM